MLDCCKIWLRSDAAEEAKAEAALPPPLLVVSVTPKRALYSSILRSLALSRAMLPATLSMGKRRAAHEEPGLGRRGRQRRS